MGIVTNAVHVLILVTSDVRKNLVQTSDPKVVVKSAKVIKELQELVKKYDRL
jgi:hypothetical protein